VATGVESAVQAVWLRWVARLEQLGEEPFVALQGQALSHRREALPRRGALRVQLAQEALAV